MTTTAWGQLIDGFTATPEDQRVGIPAPDDWQDWLEQLFPTHFSSFADRHRNYWNWIWSIAPSVRPRAWIDIEPRGGGKSTGAETGTAAVGLRGQRKYGLYVRETQDQADKSVANIATLLESPEVELHYPAHAKRKVGKYGSSKGWRRNRLWTAGGFTVDAIGLDTAARGLKVEAQRPDFMVFDDVDAKHDSIKATQKKIATITRSILPAGSSDCAVLAVQNLIIPHGIFARLSDGRADFLVDRIVSGPHPAVEGLKTERIFDEALGKLRAVITAGVATWDGQDLAACQRLMDTIGLSAFLEECQHQVHEREGALWSKDILNEYRVGEAPPLKRIVIGVDPSGGGTEIGIIAVGTGYDGRGYVIADRTQPGPLGALNWGRQACVLYDDLKGDLIAAEKNYGGDMVESNIKVAAGNRRVPVKLVNASRGKAVRAEPVSSLYSDGLVSHVGTFPELEMEMTSWLPGDPDSPNRMDALVWCLTELMLEERPEPRVRLIG